MPVDENAPDPRAMFLETASRYAHRDFLLPADGGRALTYGEFSAAARGLACRLESLGVARQDRVLALLPNSAEYALLFVACLYLGAVIVPVNIALHPRDIRFIIADAGAKLLVHTKATDVFALESNTPRWELPSLDDPLYGQTWEPGGRASVSDLLTIVYTSGTTAYPKAVAHRTTSLLGNARAFNKAMEAEPSDRFLHLFPMAYSGGFFNLLLVPYLSGASVVLTPVFAPRRAIEFWKTPMEHGVNALWLTPTIATALLMADRDVAGRAWCRGNIRKAFIGMAPLAAKVKREFNAAYGVTLLESYGLSETLLAAAQSPKAALAEGSVGTALEGVSLSVRGSDGRELPADEEGGVFIKTPHLMAGYFEARSKTVVSADPSGWFDTGDLGRLSAEGRLSVTGRRKDMIIRAGLNVSPMAVENVLLEHEAVAQAAVVGIPDALAGEEIVAVVRLKPEASHAQAKSSLEELRLTGFATSSRPSRILLRDEFPLGATGKILKRELRDWVLQEIQG